MAFLELYLFARTRLCCRHLSRVPLLRYVYRRRVVCATASCSGVSGSSPLTALALGLEPLTLIDYPHKCLFAPFFARRIGTGFYPNLFLGLVNCYGMTITAILLKWSAIGILWTVGDVKWKGLSLGFLSIFFASKNLHFYLDVLLLLFLELPGQAISMP